MIQMTLYLCENDGAMMLPINHTGCPKCGGKVSIIEMRQNGKKVTPDIQSNVIEAAKPYVDAHTDAIVKIQNILGKE